jgi:hypothetical protein
VTGDDVAWLPAASRALAVSVCEPLATAAVFQDAEYGAAPSSASKAPSTKNRTPVTPRLSAALAVTVVVPPTVAPEAGDVMLTVGGEVSGGGQVKPGMHGNWALANGATPTMRAAQTAARPIRHRVIIVIPSRRPTKVGCVAGILAGAVRPFR